MANLPETPDYPSGVYQLETSDPVLGGPGGIANRQAEQLGNRTAWLKNKVDAFIAGTTAVFKATRLATARTLSISGAGSGSAPFDGSANANIVLTLADSGVVAGTHAKVTVNAKGLVTAGMPLVPADIPTSNQAEAEAGVENTKPATSLRVFQAIRSASAVATEALRGVLRVGTQAEVNAGVLDEVAVSPKKLRWGFSASITGQGYLIFPTWLGGLAIQWGSYFTVAQNNTKYPVTFPIQFPALLFQVVATSTSTSDATKSFKAVITDASASGFSISWGDSGGTNAGIRYIALGV